HSLDVNQKEISFNKETRILLVEDNVTNQIVAKGILESIGLDMVDIANDGLEALQSLKKSLKTMPYKIILMDCMMPNMDGYEASTAIRNGKGGIENKDIPIIAMTANAMQGDRDKCILSGMNDYISKPIDSVQLENLLKKWIFNLDTDKSENKNHKGTVELSKLPLWDKNDVLKRLSNKETIVKKVVQAFLLDIDNTFEKLNESVKNNDVETSQREAHSIKGSSSNIGALRLSEFALKIEHFAQNKDMENIKKNLPEMKDIIKETKDILERYIKLS
ncbi:MAG: response regulator, partial [Campylobacterales bacterium]|nr:response regulator [Campylobacterales bacterium]